MIRVYRYIRFQILGPLEVWAFGCLLRIAAGSGIRAGLASWLLGLHRKIISLKARAQEGLCRIRRTKPPRKDVVSCDYPERQKIAEEIASKANETIARHGKPVVLARELQGLMEKGFVRLGSQALKARQAGEIRAHFLRQGVYNAHVPNFSDGVQRSIGDGARLSPFGSYDMSAILESPGLVELAFHPSILQLAGEYLGCAPTVYSMNVWWSFPGHGISVAQDFHRDFDDYRFLALFIYLTDVVGGESGGQHQYVLSTHNPEQMTKASGLKRAVVDHFFGSKQHYNRLVPTTIVPKLFSSQIVDVTGEAGSVFIADTYGIHRGVPPLKENRLVCWIRYGLAGHAHFDSTVPPSALQSRLPEDRYYRFASRCLSEVSAGY